MVLIFSQDGDFSTNAVCEWFVSNKTDFQRLNLDNYKQVHLEHDIYKDYYNLENEYSLEIPKNDRTRFGLLTEYDSVWFRKPKLILANIEVKNCETYNKSKKLKKHALHNKKAELRDLFDYLVSGVNSKVFLGSLHNARLNKLRVLELAHELEISIPNTLISSSKQDLLSFVRRHENGVIVKSLYDPIFTEDDCLNETYTSYTVELTNERLERVPENFSPSLIQEKIDKEFEIRSFYIEGRFYSMVIFSQNNTQTEVDFRKYDHESPNRVVPYKLPEALEKKLIKLHKMLGLNTGSIDLIKKSESCEYIFLEINPVGQFGMVSSPCNYNIENEIYNYLTKNITDDKQNE